MSIIDRLKEKGMREKHLIFMPIEKKKPQIYFCRVGKILKLILPVYWMNLSII